MDLKRVTERILKYLEKERGYLLRESDVLSELWSEVEKTEKVLAAIKSANDRALSEEYLKQIKRTDRFSERIEFRLNIWINRIRRLIQKQEKDVPAEDVAALEEFKSHLEATRNKLIKILGNGGELHRLISKGEDFEAIKHKIDEALGDERTPGIRSLIVLFNHLFSIEEKIMSIPLHDENLERVAKSGAGELVVIGDVHVAYSWDLISESVEGNGMNFLNPNDELNRIIGVVNSSSNALALIHNGDTVDYFFADFLQFMEKSKKERKSNWDLYASLLGKLRKPLYETIGNHDFRKEPYSYTVYKLKHVNLSEEERAQLVKEIGPHHHGFRLWEELTSIVVNESKFDPLCKHTGIKSPSLKRIGQYNCIFLNTGSDAFVRPKNWLKYLDPTIRKRISLDVEGLTRKDVAFVQSTLSKITDESTYIFIHGPLINSKKSRLGDRYPLSTTNFLAAISQQGIAYNVMLNGGGELLSVLKEAKGNITIIGAHTHNSKYYLIDKETLVAREVTINEINAAKDNPRIIKHLTIFPLGAVQAPDKITGYLRITPSGFIPEVLHKY